MSTPAPPLFLILATAVFCLDCVTPLGIAVGLLYTLAMLATLRPAPAATVGAVAVFCALLIGLGALLSPEGGEWRMVLANRLGCVAAVAGVAHFLLRTKVPPVAPLRQSVNAILGLAEVMAKGGYGPIANETYRRYVEQILVAGKDLQLALDRRQTPTPPGA